MDKIIKKYSLNDNQQEIDDREYWKEKSIEFKLNVLESLRRDAIKLGLYPAQDDDKQRLRRVFRITKQI